MTNADTGAGVDGVVLSFANGGGAATTAGGGYYSLVVETGWSGTETPLFTGGSFSPASRSFAGVAADAWNMDFVWTPPAPTVLGRITHQYTGAGVERG